MVVPGYPLAISCTPQGMVPQAVTVSLAGWAGPLLWEHFQTEAVLDRDCELLGAEVKTQSFGGDGVQPVPGILYWFVLICYWYKLS